MSLNELTVSKKAVSKNTSFCNKLQRILLGLMSSVSDKIFLFIEGWCSQCFIHPLLMMTQHELLFVHFFNDCSYLYKFTHMLLLWTIYTFFNIEMCVCVCVCVHTVICMCVYQMNWYIYIVCTYLYNSSFWSSNLIGWEKFDIHVIWELQPLHRLHHSTCGISHRECHGRRPNSLWFYK